MAFTLEVDVDSLEEEMAKIDEYIVNKPKKKKSKKSSNSKSSSTKSKSENVSSSSSSVSNHICLRY